MREWGRRLWYLLNRGRVDAALRAEMEAHRAMLDDPRAFGNVDRLREDAHDAWGFRRLDDLGRDIRLALRGLWHAAGFTAVVCVSLGLALAVSSVTAVVYAAYLARPLPYERSEHLYHVRYAPPGPWEPSGLSRLDWSAIGDVVEMPITAAGDTFYVGEAIGFSAPYRLLYVSPGFVEGLGVTPDVGRVLAPADHQDPDAMVGMIGHRIWRDRFNSDPSVIGRELRVEVDGRQRRLETFRIAGVLPDGFWFGSDSRDLVDLITPLRAPARTYRVRLRSGVPVALAERRITDAVRMVAGVLPADWKGVTLESARERYVVGVRPVLRAAAFACALIVAIACANVGVLVLLRTSRRQREFAVRLTLGAGQARIVRMLLVEAVLLVGAACAGGVALAYAALRVTGPEIARQLGRPAPGGESALQLRADILPVIALVALLGVLVAGVLPLVARAAGWHRRISDGLRRDDRTASAGRGPRRWRMALVALQIAGSLTLLVGAGLTVRSLANMVRTEFGVRTEGLVRVSIDFPSSADPDPEFVAARYQRLTEGLSTLTGGPVPLFQWPQFADAPKQPVDTGGVGAGAVEMAVLPVGFGYFDTLAIPLLQGRLFTREDRIGTEPTALVSRAAADRLWPGRNAIGRQVQVADRFISGVRDKSWRTVVGVVADVRQTYDDGDLADIYTPLEQASPARYAWFYMPLTGAGPVWEAELRRIAASIDPRASIRVAVPLAEEAARQWASPRFMALLIAILAMISVVLAVIGIYGVTAFSLERRSHDVAIRWALGATGAAMVRTLLAETTIVLVVGASVGLAGAVLLGRLLASQLHGLEPFDLLTLAGSARVIVLIALSTAAVPAVRIAAGDHGRLMRDG